MRHKDSREFDVCIVGLGLKVPDHVTFETTSILSQCAEVFFAHSERRTVYEYLRTLCPKVTDLMPLYQTNQPCSKTYDKMISAIIEAAEGNPPIGVAEYGHPQVLVRTTRAIRRIAIRRHFRLVVLPAISSLDCLFVDLNLDPGPDGLQTFEANTLLTRRYPIQNEMPCLIWQVGFVETNLHTIHPSRPERFLRLKNYLLKFYPPEHEAFLACCSTSRDNPSLIRRLPLRIMELVCANADPGSTLYIPPLTRRRVRDRAFEKALGSQEHLTQVTRPITDSVV